MKNFKYLILFFFSTLLFISCEEDEKESLNFISFESEDYDFGVELEGTTEVDFKVYTANLSTADRTFNIHIDTESSSLDPDSYSIPTTVTVPANSNVGILPISISDINIGENGETLVLEFTPTNGLYIGKPALLNVKQVCPFNELLLNITFDDYAEETWWELLDSDNNVIAFSTEGDYTGEFEFSKSFCLPNGDYTFTIFDAWGDGTGDYQLVTGETILASGGGFEFEDVTTFSLPQ